MIFFKRLPNIKKVIPIDREGLVVLFDNQEYRLFPRQIVVHREKYNFLFSHKTSRSFQYDSDKIVWANNKILNKKKIYRQSERLNIDDLLHKCTTLHIKNQAPTEYDKTHHEFIMQMHPFDHDRTFILSESIGGGHAERGGSHIFSLEKLLHYKNWKYHLEKSGCEWLIDIIEQNQLDIEKIIDLAIVEFIKRS